MGTLAKLGIIAGKKVALSRKESVGKKPAELSPLDNRFIRESDLSEFLVKLHDAESFSSDEIATFLNNCSLPMLLKIVGLTHASGGSIVAVPTLYLPIDSWLDKNDPLSVMRRAVSLVRRQKEMPQRLFVEIRDFSDLEHLWPDILDELRSATSEQLELIAPDPEVLMDWINRNDATGSRTVRKYQLEQKLGRLLDAGFDRVLPTTHSALLMHIQEAGFPVETKMYMDEVAGNEELARKLVRIRQTLMGEVELSTWMPTIQSDRRQSLPQAAVDLLIIRAHLIGSLIYPNAHQLVDGSVLSESGINFLTTAGIGGTVFTTSDVRTASTLPVRQAGTTNDATVLAGSF